MPGAVLGAGRGSCLGLETQVPVLWSLGEEAAEPPVISQGGQCKGEEMPRPRGGHTEGLPVQPVGQGWASVA